MAEPPGDTLGQSRASSRDEDQLTRISLHEYPRILVRQRTATGHGDTLTEVA